MSLDLLFIFNKGGYKGEREDIKVCICVNLSVDDRLIFEIEFF